MGAQFSLSPTFASRKLAALAFIKNYWAQRGASPSFGEIAAALGTNTTRVSHIVRKLAEEGEILRLAGDRRGIIPRDRTDAMSEGDALLLLRKAGWVINSDMTLLGPMDRAVTNPTLPLLPELDHIPDIEIGGISHGRFRTGADDRAE